MVQRVAQAQAQVPHEVPGAAPPSLLEGVVHPDKVQVQGARHPGQVAEPVHAGSGLEGVPGHQAVLRGTAEAAA